MEFREEEVEDEEDDVELFPMREVAALNADEEVGAEKPPAEFPELLPELPLPPVTAEEVEDTAGPASVPDASDPPELVLPRLLPKRPPLRFVPAMEAVTVVTSPRPRPDRFALS